MICMESAVPSQFLLSNMTFMESAVPSKFSRRGKAQPGIMIVQSNVYNNFESVPTRIQDVTQFEMAL
jgi:hypothetical protein